MKTYIGVEIKGGVVSFSYKGVSGDLPMHARKALFDALKMLENLTKQV